MSVADQIYGYINKVRQGQPPAKFMLPRVTLEQKPQDEFVKDFIAAFRATDLTGFQPGGDWP